MNSFGGTSRISAVIEAMVVAAHAGAVEQKRQGRDAWLADEEGVGELVEGLEKYEDRSR
jgi:hypothetical protein